MKIHQLNTDFLSIDQLEEIVFGDYRVEISDDVRTKIQICRDYLNRKLQETSDPIYGINTGFGSLYSKSISTEDLEKLQSNLVISHACGMGKEVPEQIVRLMLFLKAQGLAYGHSGVNVNTVQRLLDFMNEGVYPVVYQQGSLGASGDLAPLAHISLALIGKGEVNYKGERRKASEVLQQFSWEPVKLESKEGLALLNGTQFMSAYGCWNTIQAMKASKWADLIGTISLEAYDGRIDPFQENVHKIRGHRGQALTASIIRSYLEGSEMIAQEKEHVQDPYSFRCMPQVHGASKDAISYVKNIFETEINSVTDNPTIFPEEDKIVSAGNFHGQPLAIGLDHLAIALAELGSISERRLYKLISGTRGLPPFLNANSGLNSGFMIVQYSAASIVSQNKQLCTPASVDTIDSSNGQEDHVSMGANAATKCHDVVENVQKLLAIELFSAAQAIQFKRPLKSSDRIEAVVAEFQKQVPLVDNDIVMYDAMMKAAEFLNGYIIS